MIKQLVINNLKGIKRKTKEFPEFFRAWRAWFFNNQAVKSSENLGRELGFNIREYDKKLAQFPVFVVTPPDAHYMTTFFDVSPMSPNNRMLCVTKVPFINRIPVPGDIAVVCSIDLTNGVCKEVYETVGWGAQLGANVQWADDEFIVCNDVVSNAVKGIKISTSTCKTEVLSGPIYGLDPQKEFSYSGDLELINAIIPGYGVPDPVFGKKRQIHKVSASEGIWKTSILSGESVLFMSISDIVSKLPEQDSVKGGTYYVFNTKVSKDGNKIFTVLFSRNIPFRAGWAVQLVSMDIDGQNIKLAMPDKIWSKGGHHPNWSGVDNKIIMNLKLNSKKMQFVEFDSDGSNIQPIAKGVKGSGHPSLSPDGKFLLTDAYVNDGFTDKEGFVPIRLIDLEKNIEIEICRIFTNNLDGPRRVDPHPVWIDNGKKIIFNAIINGYRQVLMADLSRLYDE